MFNDEFNSTACGAFAVLHSIHSCFRNFVGGPIWKKCFVFDVLTGGLKNQCVILMTKTNTVTDKLLTSST